MNAITQAEKIALTLPPAMRAAVVLKSEQTRKELAVLVQKSAGILTVTNPAGRDEAHRAGMTLKNTRVAIEKTGKMAREDATAFSKAVIAEEKSLVDIIAPEENRVLGLRDKFDEAEQARKDALIAAERKRTEGIQARIQGIRDLPMMAVGRDSAMIERVILELEAKRVDETFAEMQEVAAGAWSAALESLNGALATAKGHEAAALAAEEVRKAEALRIEQERATLAAQRAENERIANEHAKERRRLADEKAAQEAAAAQLREKAAANLRAEREAQETQMRLQREAAAENQRKLDAQAAQIAADRKAFEDEKAAAAQREADREAAETLRQQIPANHAEALEMNALVDAAAVRLGADSEKFTSEADLARCNGMVAAFYDRHAASVEAYEAAGLDNPEVTDKEIAAMGAECGMTPDAWIERLVAFCGRMTAITSTGQRYSRTTFKDNGEPVFLNADGSRSIFCDIAD